MTERLFVYGTLGPGRPNEHLMLRIGGSWQAGNVQGDLVQAGWGADMGFPALVLNPAGQDVAGHVFSSENFASHWPGLDEFEGAQYQRVLTTVTLDDGQRVDAYVYVLAENR